MSDLRTALKGDDKDVIEKKTEALAQASAAIAQRAYAPEQGGAPGGGRGQVRSGRRAALPGGSAGRQAATTWSTPSSKK